MIKQPEIDCSSSKKVSRSAKTVHDKKVHLDPALRIDGREITAQSTVFIPRLEYSNLTAPSGGRVRKQLASLRVLEEQLTTGYDADDQLNEDCLQQDECRTSRTL